LAKKLFKSFAMNSDIIRRLTPEEEEVEKKRAELAALETELAQRELDLVTLHSELHAFERKYQQMIGIRYAELDRIEAQITEYMAYLESSQDFRPSDSLKKLYREVAKQVHPDLATDEADRARRQELMAAANQAYEEADEERLRDILHRWQSSPESTKGEGIGAELIRLLRQIAQSGERLKAIEQEAKAVEQTELHQLRNKVVEAEDIGQDLLSDMAKLLDNEIFSAQERLEKIKEKLDYKNA
jgi:DnaJ-domain-containing protein 1